MDQRSSAATYNQCEERSPKKRKTENYGQDDDRNGLEEQHFLRLYTLILNDIIKTQGVSNTGIAASIERISNSFNYTTGTRFQFSEIDFKEWEYVCAYLYRYGSHGAGFARNRILNALKNCGDLGLLQRLPNLRVVCLGAGPGNDAVGLCSALAEWGCPKNLTITLVDKFQEWRLCAELALKLAKKENFGNFSDLFTKSRVNLRYARVDLPGDFECDANYFGYLEEANVIMIAKLLSILDFKECREIIEDLKSCMKQGDFVFLIDQYVEDLWDGFEVIYTWGTRECDIYQSSAEARPRFYSFDDVQSKFAIRILRLKSKN